MNAQREVMLEELTERLAGLEQQMAALRDANRSMAEALTALGAAHPLQDDRRGLGSSSQGSIDAGDKDPARGRSSRRTLLRTALGVAVVGAAGARTAFAASDRVRAGQAVVASNFVATGAPAGGAGRLFGFDASSPAAGFSAGVAGTGADFGVRGDTTSGTGVYGSSQQGVGVYGESNNNIAVKGFGATGVSGQSTSSGGTGVVGRGEGYGVQGLGYRTGVRGAANGYGGEFSGEAAALHLVPATTAGHPTNGMHQQGELLVDVNGVLWLCTAGGSPGSWASVIVQRE